VIGTGCRRASWIGARAALIAVALVVGVAACGGSATKTVTATAQTSNPAPATSTTAAPPSATTTTAAPASSTTAAPASNSSSSAAIPDYKPSTVVSKAPTSTVLTTSASVSQVGKFYAGVLAKGGWQVTSAVTTPHSANFTARRSGQGVNISVYPHATGSGISISTHPE
jgi:hypothetical protein